MTGVLQVILLLATLIWTIVKIAQAIKDLEEGGELLLSAVADAALRQRLL